MLVQGLAFQACALDRAGLRAGLVPVVSPRDLPSAGHSIPVLFLADAFSQDLRDTRAFHAGLRGKWMCSFTLST